MHASNILALLAAVAVPLVAADDTYTTTTSTSTTTMTITITSCAPGNTKCPANKAQSTSLTSSYTIWNSTYSTCSSSSPASTGGLYVNSTVVETATSQPASGPSGTGAATVSSNGASGSLAVQAGVLLSALALGVAVLV